VKEIKLSFGINLALKQYDVHWMYSFSTLVTHCLCDLITIVDNIHRELKNQVIDVV